MVERLCEEQRDDSSNLSVSTKFDKITYRQKWHQVNKARRKPLLKEQKIARTAKYREQINEIKNTPCLDCGKSYPPYVMDFDHRDSAEKHESLRPHNKLKGNSGMVAFALRFGWDKFLDEISKCDIVCANCHRERTHNP